MKRLIDAFLELPTWQGVQLIAAFVFITMMACLLVAKLAYRRGKRDEERARLNFLNRKNAPDSIRL